jgi:hypothetical protein
MLRSRSGRIAARLIRVQKINAFTKMFPNSLQALTPKVLRVLQIQQKTARRTHPPKLVVCLHVLEQGMKGRIPHNHPRVASNYHSFANSTLLFSEDKAVVPGEKSRAVFNWPVPLQNSAQGCELRFGRMSRLGQDRGLCLSGSST